MIKGGYYIVEYIPLYAEYKKKEQCQTDQDFPIPPYIIVSLILTPPGVQCVIDHREHHSTRTEYCHRILYHLVASAVGGVDENVLR